MTSEFANKFISKSLKVVNEFIEGNRLGLGIGVRGKVGLGIGVRGKVGLGIGVRGKVGVRSRCEG